MDGTLPKSSVYVTGSAIANETRLRAGLLIGLDKATIDMAFAFTDYVARDGAPGARLFAGSLAFASNC